MSSLLEFAYNRRHQSRVDRLDMVEWRMDAATHEQLKRELKPMAWYYFAQPESDPRPRFLGLPIVIEYRPGLRILTLACRERVEDGRLVYLDTPSAEFPVVTQISQESAG